MNRILLIVWLLLGALPTFAEKFSYLYIQGDQNTPFYVKLDDAMQPRYGKNYCIVPKLAPGPIHIEVLFQQNIYPAQQFNIQIPEDGSRGFLLVKGKDSSFQLYDLHQGFFLKADNNINEDRVPPKIAAAAVPTAAAPVKATPPAKTNTIKTTPAKSTIPPAAPGAPVFIGDLELSNQKRAANAPDSNLVVIEDPVTGATTHISASCDKALTSDEFEPVFQKFSRYSNDEEKLEFIHGQLDACYATWQVRSMAENLQSDAARFSLFKKLYPRTSDRSAFPLLDDVIIDATWKAEFEKLIHP